MASNHPDNVTKKWGAIQHLMDKYKLPASKTVFFDDNKLALEAAKKNIPGINTQLASSYCKGKWCAEGCGLTKDEFDKGFAKTQKP
jgi:hypothetical protein